MTLEKADSQFTSYHSLVFERRRKQHRSIVQGDALFYNSFAEAFELCLTVGISQVEQTFKKMNQQKESLKKVNQFKAYTKARSLLFFSRRCAVTKRAGLFNRFCRRHSPLPRRCEENARSTDYTDQGKLNQQSKVKLVLRTFPLENERGGKRVAPLLPHVLKKKPWERGWRKVRLQRGVLALFLYGVFPGLLGKFTSVTYPRRTGGKHSSSRNPKRIGREE